MSKKMYNFANSIVYIMTSKVYSQSINDIKDYIDGLKESFLISPEILDYTTQSSECDFSHLQKQIIESPEDEDLKDLMEGEFSDAFIGLFLRLPLVQAFQYLSHNTITIDVPDEYYLEDNEQVYEEFKTIKRVVRVEVFNRLCKCYPNKRTLFKNAILDLDGDSMKNMLDDEEIELKWFRNWMGSSLYHSSVFTDAKKMKLPIKDGCLYVGDCSDSVNINQEEEQPYLSEMVESNYEHTKTHTRGFFDAKLTLKHYWFNHSRYGHNERQVIDDYINKPCFSKFVSECWAEFEEDERQRAVEAGSDVSWLPEDFFSDSNLPDMNKNNWLRGIEDAVIHGWYNKEGPQNDVEKEGDGRLKLMALINGCAEMGFISNDNVSKSKMAYVLTGRNVGFDVTEQKPLNWKTEYKNCFYYLVKYLFNPVSYKKALSVVDGVGQYPSKVSSRSELEQMGNDKPLSQFDVDPNRLPGLADEPERKDFRIFVHNLYDFCPDHRPKRGEGKHTAPRPPKKKDKTEAEG